jgi:cellulose synthase/poly-beta-1,6-N-acetylglucosamine synthase-like glycosyltransferase
VIVTVLDDPRLERTVESLLGQSCPPIEILVADGGQSPVVRSICERLQARDPRVRRIEAPGSILVTRNRAIQEARGEVLAFLDTDEIAPPHWLAKLIEPFGDPRVGFTGGPTPAMPATCRNRASRYYDAYIRRLYDRVARHRPHALPMGNSAWRRAVFEQVGLLDLSLSRIGRGESEDQEVALRALSVGFRGVYVPEAFAEHDFTGVNLRAVLRKQRQYARGGYLVWRRTGATYEAEPGRLLPYLALPAGMVIGLLLLLPAATREAGAILALLGGLGLVGLALFLTAQGLREDATYPGYRYRSLEILRRWATLLGALQGALTTPAPPHVPALLPPDEKTPSAAAKP